MEKSPPTIAPTPSAIISDRPQMDESNIAPRRLNPTDESVWGGYLADFFIDPQTIYLNHGSFGITPNRVRLAVQTLQRSINLNPMDFFLYRLEDELAKTRQKLAEFLGTEAGNLALIDNATYAMSIVVNSTLLVAGDQVLIIDQEYEPVRRMWQQRCAAAGADLVTFKIPVPLQSPQELIDQLIGQVTEKTRILVISHVMSRTALVMPIAEICQRLQGSGVAVVVDGPHGPAQLDMNLNQLGCDFYAASCHKWMSAPLGTGFLFVHPRWQEQIKPLVKGWGRLPPHPVTTWTDHFNWPGTRDPSHLLAIPSAIDFLEAVGLDNFRARSRYLASYTESALGELFLTKPIADRNQGFYASMAHVPLPQGEWSELQYRLKQEIGAEVVINRCGDQDFLRVSCHLYNNTRQIDLLTKSLYILMET